MIQISVCICTYKRFDLLNNLLSSLIAQQYIDGVKYNLIVIDNDCSGSSRSTVLLFNNNSKKVNILYDIEPIKNISLARNRALRYAEGEYVAFIDDDEYACPKWLKNLYHAIVKTKADAVMGPVISVYPALTPDWIIKGRFFDRPNYENYSRVHQGRTGNALVKRKWFNKFEFDERFGLTGGEDSDLFKKIINDGGAIYWAKDAHVFENVDGSRLNIKWLLARSFRGGQGDADKKQVSVFRPIVIQHLLYRTILLTIAMLGTLLSLPFGRHKFVWWLMKISSNLGQLSVIFPYRYKEYK
ncbi:MAG: hypothetical protein CVU60_03275 [Deltaproteobacteria bacterium HGW-Deltaproteobacteria-18]|nr:MAG: hypothetical protein CVU60_03275 [Deltaproteobacteria bacterium HGW-Deltaproteobacteria-18]